jgi:hypothetical protein
MGWIMAKWSVKAESDDRLAGHTAINAMTNVVILVKIARAC